MHLLVLKQVYTPSVPPATCSTRALIGHRLPALCVLVTNPSEFGRGVSHDRCYTRHMSVPQFGRICICLGALVLLLAVLPTASSTHNANGRFEVYCDGVGFFLADIDGAPAPRKLVLFLYMGSTGSTFGGRYLGQGKWSDVFIFRNGCVPDGRCDSIAHGKVWIDAWDTPSGDDALPPKHISGEYEIDLNGQHLKGQFVAKQQEYKCPPRLCM